ncbi:hypothetical protein DID75_03160 [Candidatus Marinamargulisbacteria bacterium SCGC AG-410-N11]|nr:hypothetical protein DID75_03160 [Candidatus Marinamargulisbacteria bacterium SCGC AG-410-N11]
MINKKTIKLSKISIKHWILLSVLLFIINPILIYQAILPFKAERNFRDGYHEGMVRQRLNYAIDYLEKTKYYAPWETHYQVQLGKFYEDYANQQTSKNEKLYYLEKAITLYKEMIILDKYNPWFTNRLASTYLQLMELIPEKKDYYLTLSEKFIKKAAFQDNKNPLFLLNYATFLHRFDKKDQAIPYYEKVIQYDPRIAEAIYNLAEIYRERNNLTMALNYYKILYKNNPSFENIELIIASTLISLNKPTESIPYLEKYNLIHTKLDPLKSLGAIYYQNSEWTKATHIYEKILKHFPEDNDAKTFLVQTLVNNNQFTKASDYLTQFIKENPNDSLSIQQLNAINEFVNQQQ